MYMCVFLIYLYRSLIFSGCFSPPMSGQGHDSCATCSLAVAKRAWGATGNAVIIWWEYLP